MKCYNCNKDIIVKIDSETKIEESKIAMKYKEYNLCSTCYENLLSFGFLENLIIQL